MKRGGKTDKNDQEKMANQIKANQIKQEKQDK
jgi:hypothetical protein